MKVVKDVHKTWSFWASSVLAVLVILGQALPELSQVLPDNVYGVVAAVVAVAVPLLRSVVQPKLRRE